ncbi:MAG: hypoxanthine phosphoribosyltransferase [Alphaproteobacteria bacterium]|nr:hypoxanthine phosphoribosyltransferase [Alphaproteobacteria bacterium]MCW5743632.1 hypoxanthine phosphoribosyltransferase [Alphaproteobacteria bacterium]
MPGREEIPVRISSAEIAARIEDMARDIRASMGDQTMIVPVLTGSFVFAADLIRALARTGADWPLDFITLSSYGKGSESSGEVRIVRDLVMPVEGRDILLVDDILDTGRTLTAAREMLLARGARTVRLCTLLDKPSRRAVDLEADFVGFSVPNEFLVGYGLDHAGRHRGLSYIGVVET